jgi:hypothetical protein
MHAFYFVKDKQKVMNNFCQLNNEKKKINIINKFRR